MNYKFLLFDADDTLFDFQKSAYASFSAVCKNFSLPCNAELYETYRKINQNLWDDHALGGISKSELLVKRFADYFRMKGFTADAELFNKDYMGGLKNYGYLFDGVTEIVSALSARGHVLAIISNGTIEAQRNRLRISGLDKIFDYIFISEEVGYNKPSAEFFRKTAEGIREFKKSDALIIGDSLISDIQGGVNAGIKTCLYARERPVLLNPKPDYLISDLKELFEIV